MEMTLPEWRIDVHIGECTVVEDLYDLGGGLERDAQFDIRDGRTGVSEELVVHVQG